MEIKLELSNEEVHVLTKICETLEKRFSIKITLESYINFLIIEEIKAEINYSESLLPENR